MGLSNSRSSASTTGTAAPFYNHLIALVQSYALTEVVPMAHFTSMNVFGTNVSAVLEARGWTKQKLADLAGLHRSEVSQIIGGKRENITLRTAEQIARALELPLSELLSTRFRPAEMAA